VGGEVPFRAVFQPIRTKRLVIRAMRPDDAESLWERRNDPEVARYQDWSLPFPRERAEQIAAESAAMGGPRNDDWWMAIVEIAETGETVGDLVVHLESEGRTAEIGYTLASAHWRKGYATEATAALIEYLFETLGVTRVFGMLHPDNRASAMVLERSGMLFEGHTRSSFWLDDEVSDDWIYGMVREDWEAWRDRPRTRPEQVGLVEITPDNLAAVAALSTHRSQEAFVAPMGRSFAQALVPSPSDGQEVTPWLRTIEADGEVVGFVMLALAEGRDPFLWRLLIDRMHQRRGIASRALELVEDEVRMIGGQSLRVSWREGRGSPGDFYLARGFEPTGKVHGGETEACKPLV
jgi:RimJ/RimL family protein N-acetyltransferase